VVKTFEHFFKREKAIVIVTPMMRAWKLLELHHLCSCRGLYPRKLQLGGWRR